MIRPFRVERLLEHSPGLVVSFLMLAIAQLRGIAPNRSWVIPGLWFGDGDGVAQHLKDLSDFVDEPALLLF